MVVMMKTHKFLRAVPGAKPRITIMSGAQVERRDAKREELPKAKKAAQLPKDGE
jgi:hypothetical protein